MYQTFVGETIICISGDNYMVKQSQVACFQCFVERLRLGYIGFAGQSAAGRVVMDND